MATANSLKRLGGVVPLKDRTYLAIKRAIIDGVFRAGDALVEADLAGQLGVSKTPVREAILRLEMEGLVERVPHTGSYVRELCLEDIQDIYVIKRELEAVAVRLATSRLGPEDIAEGERLLAEEMELWKRGKVTCAELEQCVSFHEWIQEKSGNERLAALMRQLDDQALRMRMTLARVEGWLDTSAKDHEHVLEAMARGDGEEAAEFIKVHNDHILDEVKRLRTMGLVDLPERG